MLTAETAEFTELEFFRLGSLVLCGRVISLFALGAAKRNDISHCRILCMSYGYAQRPSSRCAQSAEFIL